VIRALDVRYASNSGEKADIERGPRRADFVAKVETRRVIILPSEDEAIRNRRLV
jgi:hypothetical protein